MSHYFLGKYSSGKTRSWKKNPTTNTTTCTSRFFWKSRLHCIWQSL